MLIGIVRAQFSSDLQPPLVDVCAQHNDGAGPAQLGHLQGHDADGTRPLDDCHVARLDLGLFHQCVHGYADRFGEGGMLKGHVLGDAMQDLRPCSHILGHGAADERAVAQPMRAKVVLAAEAVGALAADCGRGLTGHSVADLEAVHIGPDIGYHSRELMAQHQW